MGKPSYQHCAISAEGGLFNNQADQKRLSLTIANRVSLMSMTSQLGSEIKRLLTAGDWNCLEHGGRLMAEMDDTSAKPLLADLVSAIMAQSKRPSHGLRALIIHADIIDDPELAQRTMTYCQNKLDRTASRSIQGQFKEELRNFAPALSEK